jgi:hypothetical protein
MGFVRPSPMEFLKSSQIEPEICKLKQEKKWEDLNGM